MPPLIINHHQPVVLGAIEGEQALDLPLRPNRRAARHGLARTCGRCRRRDGRGRGGAGADGS